MHRKAPNLNAMLPADGLDERRFSNNFDQFLPGIAILVYLADIARAHCLFERDVDGMMNALEPHSNMRHKSNIDAQLRANFSFVDAVAMTLLLFKT